MIRLLTALLLAASSPPAGHAGGSAPSPIQQRVDASFSAIPIGTPLSDVRGKLHEERKEGCEQSADCEWLGGDGVRYYFWGDGPDLLEVAVKSIEASDFEGKAIPALGIGTARSRSDVRQAVARFSSEIELECGRSTCSATLLPGWVTLTFDDQDLLTEVRLDGYHFT